MSEKKLSKSKDRLLLGVCGGLAKFLGWKPSQIRALLVFLVLFVGMSILAYIILAIMMPSANEDDESNFNIDIYREQYVILCLPII